MNLILFLLLSSLVIYLFTQLYPWTGISTRRSFPGPSSSRQLSPWNPRSRRDYQRKQPNRTPAQLARVAVDIHHLQPGDVVMYRDQDFLVAEQRRVRDHDLIWQDYLLEDGYETSILSTNETGDEIYFLHPTSDVELSYPPPQTLTHQQETYTLTATGQAHIDETNERFSYYTYQSNDHVLVAEKWDTQFDVFAGEAIQLRDLTFLPGTPPEKNG